MAASVAFCVFSVASLFAIASAQTSIDNHNGSEVGKNAGIAIAISFGTIFFIMGVVNFLRWQFINRNISTRIQS